MKSREAIHYGFSPIGVLGKGRRLTKARNELPTTRGFAREAMLQFLLIPGKVETSCLIIDLRDVAIKDGFQGGEIGRCFTTNWDIRFMRIPSV